MNEGRTLFETKLSRVGIYSLGYWYKIETLDDLIEILEEKKAKGSQAVALFNRMRDNRHLPFILEYMMGRIAREINGIKHETPVLVYTAIKKLLAYREKHRGNNVSCLSGNINSAALAICRKAKGTHEQNWYKLLWSTASLFDRIPALEFPTVFTMNGKIEYADEVSLFIKFTKNMMQRDSATKFMN